jgi:multidrug efflux pump subunit AcrA (membrane-fusion protein)
MEEKNLEYLSGEAKEILSQRPSWVVKWTIGSLLGILFLLIWSGVYFSYSEIVDGEFLLTTEEPPVPVQVPKTGYLDRLLVQEGAKVDAGEMLAVFASDADLDDVLALEKQIEGLENANIDTLRSFRPEPTLQLGELAGSYENFLSVFQYIPIAGISPADQNSIFGLRQLSSQLQRSNNSLELDNQAKRNEILALEREFKNANDLYKKTLDESYSKTIFELNSKINEKLAQITTNEAQVQRNNDQIRTNQTRINEIEGQSSSGLESKLFQFKQSVIGLKSEIRRWKSQHLVTAPARGKVSFYSELSANQLLRKDELMLAIIPPNSEENFVGFANIPIEGSGRVKTGQEVKIKFFRYPFRQFGVVPGTVKKIFPLPNGDAYSVEVELKEGLHTSTGLTLEFHQQMKGRAEIITDEKLFVKKLFEELF